MFEVSGVAVEIGVSMYMCTENGAPMSYQEWIDKMKTSEEFVDEWIEALRESEYDAYFWEVGPANSHRLNLPIEFVLVESTSLLQLKPDRYTFDQHFQKGRPVVSFPNLGGDAQLVVPSPIASDLNTYAHLANFVRKAPHDQVVSFWMSVADNYERLIGVETKWLSTAGLGVSWLHVRIDSRPKYTNHTKP